MNKKEIENRLRDIICDFLMDESICLCDETQFSMIDGWDDYPTDIVLSKINRCFSTDFKKGVFEEFQTFGSFVENLYSYINVNSAPEKRIRDVLLNINPRFKDSINLIDEGLIDSLAVMMIIEKIESEFSLEFDFDDITTDNFQTMDSIIHLVMEKLNG